VITLRSKFEHVEIQRHAETQQTTQTIAAKLAQLKTRVDTLRTELEHARIERDRLVQQ
jgi:outer membrane murein-binding lipoprotein Lpp